MWKINSSIWVDRHWLVQRGRKRRCPVCERIVLELDLFSESVEHLSEWFIRESDSLNRTVSFGRVRVNEAKTGEWTNNKYYKFFLNSVFMSRIVAALIELGHFKLQWIIKLNIPHWGRHGPLFCFFEPVHWNELFEITDSRKWIESHH